MEIRLERGWSWDRISSELKKQRQDLYFEVLVGSNLSVFYPCFTLKVFTLEMKTRDKKEEVLSVNIYPFDCLPSEAVHFVIDKMIKM